MNMNFILMSIEEANKAYKNGEIPVGCVITKNNKIIASTCNTKELDKCIVSHAEIKAIIDASKNIGDWRLNDCVLYTTLFPCPMCASAIKQSRISKVYYILDSNNSYDSTLSKKILEENNRCSFEKIDIEFDLLNKFFKEIRMFNVSRETLEK